MITCIVCKSLFKPNKNWHHKTGICGAECRTLRSRGTKAKYKKTTKGELTEVRWRNNPIKKEIDKKYRQTDWARQLNVQRMARHLKKSPYAQQAKKRHDSIYSSRTQGRLRDWWAKESANGCRNCGSFLRLGVDHIMPIIKGGTDETVNLQALCAKCNGEKHTKVVAYV